ncbi:MAG: EscU/YscU/HrcU family type III secretion system export apparatus switch protein [Bacillota bacterium]|nr:EscU/YscU/HrcU family type III secretion system export apparatus switch protein [Bacillota bacterium]
MEKRPPTREERKKAAALRYDPRREQAPRLLAKGEGYMAERLLARARELGIPIYEDPPLVAALLGLDLESEIPPELYQVVAAVLAFVYRLDKTRP